MPAELLPLRRASIAHQRCQPPSAAVPLDPAINPLRPAVGAGNVMTQSVPFVCCPGYESGLALLKASAADQPHLWSAVPFSGGAVLGLRGLTTTGAGIAPLHAAGDPLRGLRASGDPDGAAEN